jgi:hypothetical protein
MAAKRPGASKLARRKPKEARTHFVPFVPAAVIIPVGLVLFARLVFFLDHL